ncbi:MAG: transposase [Planctomycetota bacterium]
MKKKAVIDFDNPWKEALHKKFDAFMLFFFPEAHVQINWSRKPVFLETELRAISKNAKPGMRRADALAKVFLKNGREQWVLVHIEIQSQRDAKFAERMYVYSYRIFERYQRRAGSFAILVDENKDWQPSEFTDDVLGTRSRFQFPTVKLLDYQTKLDALNTDPNPFAALVYAHLKVQETRRDPEARLEWKLAIFKSLFRRGWKKDDIREMMDVIDWLVVLPQDMVKPFELKWSKSKEVRAMRHVTTFEQIGMLRAIRKKILVLLKIRFGKIPSHMAESIGEVYEIKKLDKLFVSAAKVDSLEKFKV